MRQYLLRLALRAVDAFANNEYAIASQLGRKPGSVHDIAKAQQILLMSRYRELAARGLPLPSFQDVEFSAFSENGEDGILLFIFAMIGMTNRRAVELCCGSGIDCNSANLIVHHGWDGLLIDGNERKLSLGRRFYKRCSSTRHWPPRLVSEWITADNVNAILAREGFDGELDLLSLDMDGVDYWVWKALTVISPRVVVLEYQDILGPDRSVTVPYDPRFVGIRSPRGAGIDYGGASLRAFVKLARAKGYRLVGCEHYGYNAFFIRSDIDAGQLPDRDPRDCFAHPKNAEGMRKRYPLVEGRPWEEV